MGTVSVYWFYIHLLSIYWDCRKFLIKAGFCLIQSCDKELRGCITTVKSKFHVTGTSSDQVALSPSHNMMPIFFTIHHSRHLMTTLIILSHQYNRYEILLKNTDQLTFELFYHIIMVLKSSFQYFVWRIHLPTPFCSHRIWVMTPTKHTLISTCQAWSSFHTSVAFYTIETVFVAASTPTEHWLQPPTRLTCHTTSSRHQHMQEAHAITSGTHLPNLKKWKKLHFGTLLSAEITNFCHAAPCSLAETEWHSRGA